jgi:hypothetical protein
MRRDGQPGEAAVVATALRRNALPESDRVAPPNRKSHNLIGATLEQARCLLVCQSARGRSTN